jgi:hypothetical protein
MLKFDGFAFRLVSPYSFILSFAILSCVLAIVRIRLCWGVNSIVLGGSRDVLHFMNTSDAGDVFVEQYGVLR